MMYNFEGKTIMAEKNVSEETLNGLGYVLMAVFLEKYNKNVVREFYANPLLKLMILTVLLWAKCM